MLLGVLLLGFVPKHAFGQAYSAGHAYSECAAQLQPTLRTTPPLPHTLIITPPRDHSACMHACCVLVPPHVITSAPLRLSGADASPLVRSRSW